MKLYRSALVLVAAAATLLAGCSAADNGGDKLPSGDVDIKGAEITMWANGGSQTYRKQFAKVIKGFEAKTGVTVKVTTIPIPYEDKVPSRFAAGERPDLLEWQPMLGFVAELNPQKNFIDLSGEKFQSRIKFNLTDTFGAYQGKKYAAIMNYPDVTGIFYNKDVFKKLNLDIPTNKKEWFETCKAILDSGTGITPLQIGGGDKWPAQIFPFNFWADAIKAGLVKETNKNKASFTDPRWVQGIQALKTAQDDGCLNKDVLTATAQSEGEALISGKAAMVAEGSWDVGNWDATYGTEKVDSTIGFFPISEKTPTASYQGGTEGNIYVIKSGDQKREAASLAFIRYMTGEAYPQYVKDTHQPSIYKGVPDSPDISELKKAVIKPFASGEAQPNYEMVLGAFKGSFQDPLAEMLAGTKTPMQVAKSLDSQFTKSAKVLGLPGF